MSTILSWLFRALVGFTTLITANLAAGQEQVWLISTRDGGLCGATLSYSRYDGQGTWLPADAAAFAAADDPAQPTFFFVHGNRANCQDAVEMGWQVYQQLRCQSPDRAYRLVIWSWPSDRLQGGQLNDVRVKAQRCDRESLLLAQVVAQINPQVKVTFLGFSFGARIIVGASHLLAGGQLCGHALPGPSERTPMRAMLLASALDADWLLPGRRNDMALRLMDQVFITCNPADKVLKRYHWLYGHRGPDALGYAGPACPSMLGSDAAKLQIVNVSCEVGADHAWLSYFYAGTVQRYLSWYALGETPAAGPVPASAASDETPPAEAHDDAGKVAA